MIRFSAFLVVVAVGLLVAGVVTSKLLFVYIAIGVSGVALLALGIGVAVNWRELSGKSGTAELTLAETSAQGPAPAEPSEPVPAGRSRPLRLQHRPRATGSAGPAPGVRTILAQPPSPGRPAGAAPAGRPRRPVTAASIPTGPSRPPVTCPPLSRRREPSPRRRGTGRRPRSAPACAARASGPTEGRPGPRRSIAPPCRRHPVPPARSG